MKLPSLTWLQSKTARKYLHSYLMISIIPVILICLIYCVSTTLTLSQQAEETMQSQLEQLKNELDGSITYMETSAGHLSGVLSARQGDESSLSAEQLVRQLGVYQAGFQLPCEVLYYPRRGASLYTVEGETRYDDFQNSGEWRDQLDMIQFYTKLNRAQNRTLLTTRKNNGAGAGDYLVYLSPVPNLDVSPVGSIAFLLEKQQFDTIVGNCCGSFNGYLLMFDASYGLSYAYDQCGRYSMEEVTKSLTAPPGGGGVTQISLENERFVLLRSVSKNYGITYLYAIPAKTFYAPVYRKIGLFIILSGALLLILLFAAIMTTANSFRPLFQLAGDLLRGGQSGKTDLFEQIRSQYQSLETQNTSLQLQIENQFSVDRQRLLSELLYGWRGGRRHLADTLSQTGVSFLYNSFFVMAVRLEEAVDPQDAILRAFEQVRNANRQFWAVYLLETSLPHTAALLFNLDAKEGIRLQAAKEVSDSLTGAGYSQLKIGVGGFRKEAFSINASFCEALVTMQESPGIISVFQKPPEDSGNVLCPPTEGKMLQQSLLNGSEDIAAEVLRQMAAAVENRHPPFHIARCFCFYIVNLLLQIKPALEGVSMEELIYAANHAELEQFCQTAEDLLRRVCRQISDSRRVGEQKRADELMAYICQNFGDYSLSVELLADHFGLSEKTIRQILKERTGGSLTSYLTGLRMDYVKRRLADTDIPVRELISEVGYTDVSSFTRKFRQMEGVTPGQYRSMAQAERSSGQPKP